MKKFGRLQCKIILHCKVRTYATEAQILYVMFTLTILELIVKRSNAIRMTIPYPNILYSRDYYYIDIFWCVNRIGQS